MADDPPIEPDRVGAFPHPRETARLFGQTTAEHALLDAWREDRLHHGWLIRGPMGVGKATLAYRIARALIGAETGGGLFGDGPTIPDTLDTPDGCPVAARIAAGSEPRLNVLRIGLNEKTGKPRTQIVVEDVRAVKNFLQLSAADGGWRVVIVDPADAMNRSAANALLKMLEEPPARTALLLISHAPGGLLPTIRSRCRTLDLAPLGPDDLTRAIAQAGAEIPSGQAPALNELAAGSVGQALRLIEGGGLDIYAKLAAMLRGGQLDRGAMVALADMISGRQGPQLYPVVIDLTLMLIGRLARAAATGAPPAPAAEAEAGLIRSIAHQPGQATLWAEASATATERFRHARAVNLDPGQTIIDTFLDLDTILTRARQLG